MTLVVDAGPVVTMHDRQDPRQADAERLLSKEAGALILPAQITAEIDHLLNRRGGPRARGPFYDDLAAGRYVVECLRADEYRTLAELNRRYAGLDVGLTDLSIVVLARRYETRRIATFDERHFRALRPLDGGTFTLLPRDEPAT